MKALKFIFVGLAILWTLIAILLSIGLALPVALITVWFKNKLFLNSMLLVVSKTLAIGLFPIGFLYKILKVLITSEARTEHLSKYLRTVAISDDQKGNVVCGPLFNDSLITKDGYQYGNEDETISSATGKNKQLQTLTRTGRILSAILNFLDKNHIEKSIQKL